MQVLIQLLCMIWKGESSIRGLFQFEWWKGTGLSRAIASMLNPRSEDAELDNEKNRKISI